MTPEEIQDELANIDKRLKQVYQYVDDNFGQTQISQGIFSSKQVFDKKIVANAGIGQKNLTADPSAGEVGDIVCVNGTERICTVASKTAATWADIGGSGGTPAGNDTEVQFNDSSAFGAESTFTFDKVTRTITLGIKDLYSYFKTPDGSLSTDGGHLQIRTGDGEDDGGALQINTGNGIGTGSSDGGAIQIGAGSGGLSGDGAGGLVSITAGDGGLTSGDGGALSLESGDANATGDGGAVSIVAGASGGGNGGTVTLQSGNGSSSGAGGSISFVTGVAGGTDEDGALIYTNDAGTVSTVRSLDSINTTDNTYHAFKAHFATTTNSAGYIRARVVGRRTGGSAGTANDTLVTEIVQGVKNNAGVTTLIGSVAYVFFYGDNGVCDVRFAVSTNTIVLQAKGDTNNNYTWRAELWYTF